MQDAAELAWEATMDTDHTFEVLREEAGLILADTVARLSVLVHRASDNLERIPPRSSFRNRWEQVVEAIATAEARVLQARRDMLQSRPNDPWTGVEGCLMDAVADLGPDEQQAVREAQEEFSRTWRLSGPTRRKLVGMLKGKCP